jgi:hypothetical protein
LQNNATFDTDWFNIWLSDMKKIKTKLQSAQEKNKLLLPITQVHRTNLLWSLYESYIHMTNNRLGVTANDEALIAYIISQSLKR